MWTNREYKYSHELFMLEDMRESLDRIRSIIGYPRQGKGFSGAGLGRKHKRRSRNRDAVLAARRANVARIRLARGRHQFTDASGLIERENGL